MQFELEAISPASSNTTTPAIRVARQLISISIESIAAKESASLMRSISRRVLWLSMPRTSRFDGIEMNGEWACSSSANCRQPSTPLQARNIAANLWKIVLQTFPGRDVRTTTPRGAGSRRSPDRTARPFQGSTRNAPPPRWRGSSAPGRWRAAWRRRCAA
jgi:hypothetical protein